MRSNMTKEEAILWNVVRAKRFYGYKFKRQVLIGNYIVDFLCKDKKLIIEIDGGQHNREINIQADLERTKYLNSEGFKVLRIWNNDILKNLDSVCECIYNALNQ